MKKTFHVPSGADSTARLFALISTLVAVAALYFSALSPADLKVTLIDPEFEFQSFEEHPRTVPLSGSLEAVRGKSSFLLIANCTFANNGAQIGDISRIAVRLVSDDGATWLFVAYKLLDDLPRITDRGAPVGYDYQKAPPFSTILVPGKQTSRHLFLFVEDSTPDLVPSAHKFKASVWVWYGLSPEPHEQQISTLDFNEKVVAVLKTGALTSVPFDEERQQLKQLANVK
jgi:hypothetical protein